MKTIMVTTLKGHSKPKFSNMATPKGPLNEGFRRVQLMDTSAPKILSADSLHDDGASVWARDDGAEGHFKKQLFGPLHPSTLRSSQSGG